MKDIYFALEPTSKIGSELLERVEKYDDYISSSGRGELWRRSYEFYYRQSERNTKGRLTNSGEQGEFTDICINHYRNLLIHLKTMVTQQRPAFDARATNTDVKSMSQTILANSLLEYYTRQKKMERYTKQAVESCLVLGEGFVSIGWESEMGDNYGVNPDTGAETKEGDIAFDNFLPNNVIRDFQKQDAQELEWVILRKYTNRYTLAAKYPELADSILALTSDDNKTTIRLGGQDLQKEDSDDVAHYVFYHMKGQILPEGRYVEFLDDELILFDGPSPYRDVPVYRIASDEQMGTIFGYSVGFELLPIQEALNGLYSTVLTNQSTFGVQNIISPAGSNLSVSDIANGLNLIEYDPKLGPPASLNLTQTPAEIFNFMQQLEQLAETISNVNSVTRGNPEASLKSGAAIALVQSLAVQASMGLQHSYTNLLEDLATSVIYILRDYAAVPRVSLIAGQANRSLMKEWSGQDLSEVNRVLVDLGNPLTRTVAGRVNLAESLLSNNLIPDAQAYIEVLESGRLEPVVEGVRSELLLVRAENERLANGGTVQAALTDNHLQHIQHHKVVIASPEAREDFDVVQNTLAHLQEHLDILMNPANAQMLQVLGQQPVAGPQPQNAEAMNAQQLPDNSLPNEANLPSAPQGTDPRSAEVMAEQRASLDQMRPTQETQAIV